ncbi:hypothetical protein MTO96_045649 [Rhipicephalus appendiculatus]
MWCNKPRRTTPVYTQVQALRRPAPYGKQGLFPRFKIPYVVRRRRGERARAARSKSPAASPPPDLAFGGNLEFPAMTSGTEADSQGRSGSRDHSRARGRSRSRGAFQVQRAL